jgi:hypothetical protein
MEEYKMKADTFVAASPRWGLVSLTGWNFLGNSLFSWSSYCISIATQGCWLPAWTCLGTRESTSPPIGNPEEWIDVNAATSLNISNVLGFFCDGMILASPCNQNTVYSLSVEMNHTPENLVQLYVSGNLALYHSSN